jgi:hypothetical protein
VKAGTVAVKLALAAPAAIVTEDGTVTAELLLARLTIVEALAAALNAAVQLVVPAPVKEVLAQLRPVSVGAEEFEEAAVHV